MFREMKTQTRYSFSSLRFHTQKNSLINLILESSTTNFVSWTTLIYRLEVLEVKILKWVLRGLKYRCQLELISCIFQLLEATHILWFMAPSLYCFLTSIFLTLTLIFSPPYLYYLYGLIYSWYVLVYAFLLIHDINDFRIYIDIILAQSLTSLLGFLMVPLITVNFKFC